MARNKLSRARCGGIRLRLSHEARRAASCAQRTAEVVSRRAAALRNRARGTARTKRLRLSLLLLLRLRLQRMTHEILARQDQLRVLLRLRL